MTMLDELYPVARVADAAAAARQAGLDALLLTPGPDLRYVAGYDAHAMERLTCLAVPASSDPFLVVPRLELPAAQASPARLGLDLIAWDETDDPYELVARRLGQPAAVGLADRMWALMVLRFAAVLPGARQDLASRALGALRARKSAAEVAALREAGQAIDRVHAQVPGWLRPGRTEAQVAADIADAILAHGHATVDFTIVDVRAERGESAPHRERPGACGPATRSWSTSAARCRAATARTAPGRTRSARRQTTSPSTTRCFKDAQDAACAAVRPGATAESVDAAAREPISAAGYGPFFVHRTGHGIGLETHEDPYIVAGNAEPLRPGARLLGRAGDLSWAAWCPDRRHRRLH